VNDARRLHGDISWARHFAALVEYKKQHGTANVSLKTTYECILPGMGDSGEDYKYQGNLGFWLNRQRQAKKGLGPGGKQLSEERVSQMQVLVDEGKCIIILTLNLQVLYVISYLIHIYS